jgi:hypothetical protein
MFACEFCGRTTEPGEGRKTIVTEWRKKTYPSKSVERKYGDLRPKFYAGGEGYEAATTGNACPTCVAEGRAKDAPVPEIIRVQTAPVRDFPVRREERNFQRRDFAGRQA